MIQILLVDDDEAYRRVLAQHLKRAGLSVRNARNGKEAMNMVRESTPDIVITDLIMPDQEGLETIRQLRKEAPSVKIIAMSGGGRVDASDYLRVARGMGAHQALTKPFEVLTLLSAIEDLTGIPIQYGPSKPKAEQPT